MCSTEYEKRLDQIELAWKQRKEMTDEQRVKAWGDLGEANVLRRMESTCGVVVFWNVGLRIGNGSEYDILAVSRHGLLHIEVKNFTGQWRPADGQPQINPDPWQKVGGNGEGMALKPLRTEALHHLHDHI